MDPSSQTEANVSTSSSPSKDHAISNRLLSQNLTELDSPGTTTLTPLKLVSRSNSGRPLSQFRDSLSPLAKLEKMDGSPTLRTISINPDNANSNVIQVQPIASENEVNTGENEANNGENESNGGEERKSPPQPQKTSLIAMDISNFKPESKKSESRSNTMEENQKQESSKSKISLSDFQIIGPIGKGAYGEVALVKKITNAKQFALKIIDKNFLRKEQKQYQVYMEREVLLKLNHPNIIKLYSSFQDKSKLYFVLEYCPGGEFSDYLRVQRQLIKEQIRFYAAEIISIIEYLHANGVAHRDMKPENLLLNDEGHLKVIDFGTAKYINSDTRPSQLYGNRDSTDIKIEVEIDPALKRNYDHRSTFVGTAQYVSPEMLEDSVCEAPADLWALGCIIFVMAVAQYPFHDQNEYLIFQKIKSLNVVYPENMDPQVKDLIQSLLKRVPLERLGAGPKGSSNDYAALKKHPLFEGIDFDSIHLMTPPAFDIQSPFRKKKTQKEGTPEQKPAFDTVETPKQEIPEPEERKEIKLMLSGLVLKKCGWLFYKPRQLILTDAPKLVYYDPATNMQKGEIKLLPDTKAEFSGKTQFIISTTERKYFFKAMEHPIEKWVELINATVKQLHSK